MNPPLLETVPHALTVSLSPTACHLHGNRTPQTGTVLPTQETVVKQMRGWAGTPFEAETIIPILSARRLRRREVEGWPEVPEPVRGQLEAYVPVLSQPSACPSLVLGEPQPDPGFVVSKPGRSGNMLGDPGVAVTHVFNF